MASTLLTNAQVMSLIETGLPETSVEFYIDEQDAFLISNLGPHDLNNLPDTAQRRIMLVGLVQLVLDYRHGISSERDGSVSSTQQGYDKARHSIISPLLHTLVPREDT